MILLFTIPYLVLGTNQIILKKRPNKPVIYILSFIAIYLTILVYVQVIDEQLRAELYSFDLNQNGYFEKEEITPEQEQAMLKYISDTGRNFAPITGLFCALFICAISYTLNEIISAIKLKKEEKTTI